MWGAPAAASGHDRLALRRGSAATARSAATRALFIEISPRIPGAATISPARKTSSPRSIAGRSRQVRPGRSRAPVRPFAVPVRENVVLLSRQGMTRSANSASRCWACPGDSPARTGICNWNSDCPAGAMLSSCMV